jgi:hypothetical protein
MFSLKLQISANRKCCPTEFVVPFSSCDVSSGFTHTPAHTHTNEKIAYDTLKSTEGLRQSSGM